MKILTVHSRRATQGIDRSSEDIILASNPNIESQSIIPEENHPCDLKSAPKESALWMNCLIVTGTLKVEMHGWYTKT